MIFESLNFEYIELKQHGSLKFRSIYKKKADSRIFYPQQWVWGLSCQTAQV